MRFLDTNVFLRYLVADLPDQSPRSTELFLAIEQGEEQVQTSQVVILEVVFTLQRFYRLSLVDIRDQFLPVVQLPGIRLDQKEFLEPAFDLAILKNIGFQEALNVVIMQHLGLSEVYSWDRHFDRVVGIQRIEPGTPDPNL
ncbi:MAG: PIN domain-containing protein [Sphaerobacteraceae bacterium]|nr:MAG: PIN domain-containing protein [Sphaerobacteraceae bacterium]